MKVSRTVLWGKSRVSGLPTRPNPPPKANLRKPTQAASMRECARSKNIPVYIAFLMQVYEEITPLSKCLLRGYFLHHLFLYIFKLKFVKWFG